MTITNGFILFLGLTVVLLVAVILTGLRARRRLHLPLVAATVVSLGVAIWYAEQLGTLYDLESAGRIYPIHIWIAKLATASYLLPIGTGIATLKTPKLRRWHRRFAFLVVALTLTAAGTGTAMVSLATRLPA